MRVERIAVGRVAPVERRPERPDLGAREAPAHGERITLGPDVLEATRDLPDPAKGDVRWYRARRISLELPGMLEALPDEAPAAPASSAGAGASLAYVLHPRAAVAAYRRVASAAPPLPASTAVAA